MKKLIGKIFYFIIMFSFIIMVFANSGPVFWQGYPSSDIMSIEENSPISVKNENLIFDFSDCEDSGHTIIGKVTATYEMVNPTSEMQSVQMAFPFVGTLGSFSQEGIVITADGSSLPYDVYVGSVVNSYGNPREEEKEISFDFDDIISTITDESYSAKNFTENEKGKLYLIDVKPAADQGINLAVNFSFDYEKTKIITSGFNGYERNNEKTSIVAWCYEPRVLEIYVLGEDIDFNINGYTDGELSKKTDLFNYQIYEQEVELRQYLMEYIKKNAKVKNDSVISGTQLYNIYAEALDRDFTQNIGYSSENDIMEREHSKRILTLVYTVEFPPDSEKRVSVSYKTSGTMDKRETAKPLYSFDYILNPAENWSDFKNLNIQIIPPQEAPYIVKSSIEFTKGENNVYTSALENLPKNDLFFTLYENEKITLLDKAVGNLNNSFGYFYPLVIGVIALITGIITIMIVIKFFRK